MKAAALREATTEELADKLAVARQDLLNLRVRQGSGTLEQPSRVRLLRREIARIQTLLREREKSTR